MGCADRVGAFLPYLIARLCVADVDNLFEAQDVPDQRSEQTEANAAVRIVEYLFNPTAAAPGFSELGDDGYRNFTGVGFSGQTILYNSSITISGEIDINSEESRLKFPDSRHRCCKDSRRLFLKHE